MSRSQSPALGGFRHKHTNVLYLNATTQTPHPVKTFTEENRPLTRETQTKNTRKSVIQTERESGTQTATPNMNITDPMDKHVIPRPYVTSEEFNECKLRATITIQRYFRGYLARKLYRVLQQAVTSKLETIKELQFQKESFLETKQLELLKRKQNPLKKQDFDLLLAELKEWKQNEMNTINCKNINETEKKQLLKNLYLKEIEHLQNIEKLRVKAQKSAKSSRISKTLDILSRPNILSLSETNSFGESIEVVTPEIQQSQIFVLIYKELLENSRNVDARLELLLRVKNCVRDFDCDLTVELCDLIDREADLLNRDRPGMSLEGLRARIAELFYLLIQIPQFNPIASKLNKKVTLVVDETSREDQQSRCSVALNTEMDLEL
ncbi:hypothetical protein P9112_012681 [Eukaryota sp. TZLM1-RC]